MALVRIYGDEWWPVPSYSRAETDHEFYGEPVEVPDEIIAQYDAAKKGFAEAATTLAAFHSSPEKVKLTWADR